MVEDLGDAELLEVCKARLRREFCWTCSGPLMLGLLRETAFDALNAWVCVNWILTRAIAAIRAISTNGHRYIGIL